MRIPKGKQITFLERIIEDTKSGAVYWDRISSDSRAARETFPGEFLDPEGVFLCGFRNTKTEAHFLIAMDDTGKALAAIGVDYEQMISFEGEEYEDVDVLLTRLFNLVFDKWPNVNKFIDEYLLLDPGEDTHQ